MSGYKGKIINSGNDAKTIKGNGDKYETLETTIKKGTPYVQVIPFKRESWRMKIKGKTTKQITREQFGFSLKLLHKYKSLYWNKKSWK